MDLGIALFYSRAFLVFSGYILEPGYNQYKFKGDDFLMERIAIVGMGTSGMAVAAAYEKEVNTENLTIDCYDSKESFGRGYPYREDSPELLLNLKTRKISYNYQDNDDLYNWLRENKLDIEEYTSRSLFGQYTRDRLMASLKNIGANIIYEKIQAIDYLEDTGLWQLESQSGDIKTYDRVHLCLGELGQKDLYKLSKSSNYIGSVYPVEENLKDITEDGEAIIVGMGLTGVDVASYLLEVKKLKKLYMFSRTNIIPTVRVDPVEIEVREMTYPRIFEIIEAGKGYISFDQFDQLFQKELEAQTIDYDDFLKKHMSGGIEGLQKNLESPDDLAIVQALLPPMNLVFNKVWSSMGLEDRRKFREKYHGFMCLNRSPLPIPSAKILIEAYDQGRLKVLENVEEVIESKNSFQALDSSGKTLARSQWLINATGLDTSLESIDRVNPLLKDLLNKRLVGPDSYGGLAIDPRDMSIISPRYGSLRNLHGYGVLASGVQYRNNSTLIIQKTAHDLMKKFY